MHFFETIKAANTGITQLNFITLPKYTHRNVSNIYVYTFFILSWHLAAYAKHFYHTNHNPGPVNLVPPRLGGPIQICLKLRLGRPF